MHQPHFLFATMRRQSSPSAQLLRLPIQKKVAVSIILMMTMAIISVALAEDLSIEERSLSADESGVAKRSIVRAMSEIESGSLLFQSENNNHYLRAPLLETSVEIGVQGMIARTVVEQKFTNNTIDWVEGIYTFPLIDNTTVDELTLIVGESVIEGVIQTRKKARTTYTNAKATGRKASLLEHQRPNLFTTQVANIPPGESVTVRIGFQSAVRYSDGEFSLSFPLTITPRYIPADHLSYSDHQLTKNSNNGWTTLSKLQDASNITPPMTDTASPASISVRLDTGLNGLIIKSSTHDIISTRSELTENNIWHVSLANRLITADRDFKLSWSPQATDAPVAAVFRQDKTRGNRDETFASVMLMPPQQIYTESVPAREVVFVIDTSQSMGGNSIRQARRMLTIGIERLSSDDYFNVLAFNNNTSKLFAQSIQANDQNKTQAINWVQSLSASGGTEILGALKSALESRTADQRFQQIVFVTDGSVGNESDIFSYLKNNIGNSRLFTVGIGSAPNTWFMRRSSELGRGTYTSIANTTELAEKALNLLAKLEQPAITDIKIQFDTDTPPEIYPAIMPDVYLGEPVLADARWLSNITQADIKITGRFAGQMWEQSLKLDSNSNQTTTEHTQPGLDKLWAGRKIHALEDSLLFNNNFDQIEKSVTDIALAYSMVSKYTSLVAVEDKISRDPDIKTLHTTAVPLARPAGNTMHYPQGSLGTTLRFMLALLFASLALFIALLNTRQATPKPASPKPGSSVIHIAHRLASKW